MIDMREFCEAYVMEHYWAEKLKKLKSEIKSGTTETEIGVGRLEAKTVETRILDRKLLTEEELNRCMVQSFSNRINVKVDPDFELSVLKRIRK